MTTNRRPYKRESEETRREALIEAALELVAEGGPQAASVRAIADRAGVTPGLIRHYFSSKEELNRAAYRRLIGKMTVDSLAAAQNAGPTPQAQLSAYVTASLRPPIVDRAGLIRWAGFLNLMLIDDQMRDAHKQGYLAYRDHLQRLIEALPRNVSAAQARADAIACNATIDGLWLEGSATSEDFAEGEIEAIGLAAVSAILGIALPKAE
jgi:TetR/AcrR family transcriptional repressor of bet genes